MFTRPATEPSPPAPSPLGEGEKAKGSPEVLAPLSQGRGAGGEGPPAGLVNIAIHGSRAPVVSSRARPHDHRPRREGARGAPEAASRLSSRPGEGVRGEAPDGTTPGLSVVER